MGKWNFASKENKPIDVRWPQGLGGFARDRLDAEVVGEATPVSLDLNKWWKAEEGSLFPTDQNKLWKQKSISELYYDF